MKLITVISTVTDGNMLIRDNKANQDIIDNRNNFLAKNDIEISQTVMVSTVYGGDDYCRYHEISDVNNSILGGDTIPADALVTKSSNLALFLPIADCVGMAVFDPNKNVLMMSHLGRHSLEQNGGYKSIQFLIGNYQCNPSDLLVWLTPAPGKDNYPFFAFDGKSIKEAALQQLQSAGILSKNITDNPADTTTDQNYYSHSEFLKGNQKTDGRFAIVAMMTD